MNIIEKFQNDYPTKKAKEEALKKMTNEQIDELIEASGNTYAKIFYSSFKKQLVAKLQIIKLTAMWAFYIIEG